MSKMEADYQTIEESTRNWMEQVQIGEYERTRRLDQWRRDIDEQKQIV